MPSKTNADLAEELLREAYAAGRASGYDQHSPQGYDQGTQGADQPSSAQAQISPPGDSNFNPLTMQVNYVGGSGSVPTTLNANLFYWSSDLMNQSIILGTTLASPLVSGAVSITPAQFAAALPQFGAQSWLQSSFLQYQLDVCYLVANPSALSFLNMVSSEANTSAPLLTSLQLTITRTNPFGFSSANNLPVQNFRSPYQFQQNQLNIKVSDYDLNLFNYINFASIANNSGAVITFTVVASVSRRRDAATLLRDSIQASKPASGRRVDPALGGASAKLARLMQGA